MLNAMPAGSELEVSIFGPGIGESIVVHLGGGKWMIVDSCLNPDSRRPASLEYLEALGVDAARDVALVVVTHWHDDHTAGVSQVLRACAGATFFCSAALNRREFFQLVASAGQLELRAGAGSGVDEMRRVFDVLKERLPQARGRSPSPEYAAANTVIYRRDAVETTPSCVVEALSPSSTSVTRGMLSFSPTILSPKKTIPNPGPNELSVVIHVQLGDVAALLGADLEVGSSDAVGWRGVVSNTRKPSLTACIVKVPHHGSAGADHEPAWNALVGPTASAGVTPFSSSRLPKSDDVTRLRSRTANLFHASPARGRAVKFDNATRRTLEGVKVRERRSSLGHIRFRASGNVVGCELFGAAKVA